MFNSLNILYNYEHLIELDFTPFKTPSSQPSTEPHDPAKWVWWREWTDLNENSLTQETPNVGEYSGVWGDVAGPRG